MTKIVLDAMGGDDAPGAIVEGAVLAAAEFDCEIILVGVKEKIESELKKYPNARMDRISIEHASDIVEMHEHPALAIRKKKNSSISIGMDLVADKKADVFISAGNTGAVVVAATLKLRLLPDIERPGIAIVVPTAKGFSMIIDVGANIAPTPKHLLHYAVMADAYSKHILGKKNPSIGLLSIGEEETKGTDFIKDAYKSLSETDLNFIGNIEGKDIFAGKSDVVVCDGFVGNVVLKVAESIAEAIGKTLKKYFKSNIFTKLMALLIVNSRGFKKIIKEMDYSEYGGAPLLGVDGSVIISHGRSSAKAIKNAVKAAKHFVDEDVNTHILKELEGVKSSNKNNNG